MKAGIPVHGHILGARTGPTQRIVGTQSIEQGKEPSLAAGSQLSEKIEPCIVVFKWKLEFPVALGGGGGWGPGDRGRGDEGSGREAAEAGGAGGWPCPLHARPVSHVGLPQLQPGGRCQDRRAHSSRGDTEAQRGDSWACWRLPARRRQLAEASGSGHEQGIRPQLPGAPGWGLGNQHSQTFPFSKKAKGSVTLGRLPTASELGLLLGAHEGPGDPSPRADAQAQKSLVNCRKGTRPLSLLVLTHTGSCFLPRPSCSPPGLVGVNPEPGLLGQLGRHLLPLIPWHPRACSRTRTQRLPGTALRRCLGSGWWPRRSCWSWEKGRGLGCGHALTAALWDRPCLCRCVPQAMQRWLGGLCVTKKDMQLWSAQY